MVSYSYLKTKSILFFIAFLVGLFFNPVNFLVNSFNDLNLSLTGIYSGLVMASNMIWVNCILHYISTNKFKLYEFLFGISLSTCLIIFFLRKQLFVDDEQWLRRMISDHSTGITTSNIILKKTKNETIRKLAKDIIEKEEKQIELMKSLLK